MLFDEALTGSLFDTLLWCLTPKGRLLSPSRWLCDTVAFQLVDDLYNSTGTTPRHAICFDNIFLKISFW